MTAGRSCPTDYRYAPETFARAPEIEAETLFVVGGLYGNRAALAEIGHLAAQEPVRPTIVFNGDAHWFDVEGAWFDAIEDAVAPHPALRGNVETEIARDGDIGAGCGCAYPDDVSDLVVTRSNAILARLRETVRARPAALARLSALPMSLVARVGGLRVGIVHGDAESLAGWRFAQDRLDEPLAASWLAEVRRRSTIDVFASTHTCLPALRCFDLPTGRLTVINNGAAGMPNFAGSRFGLLTRISIHKAPRFSLYGVGRDNVHVEALPVRYDHAAFVREFRDAWPPGSDADLSYRARIENGPAFALADAARPARYPAAAE